MKPAYYNEKNLVATLRGRYINEKKLVLFQQKEGGMISVFLVPIANGGIHNRMEFIGSAYAADYHCDECICHLTKDQVEEFVRQYCDATYNDATDEQVDEGCYYTFQSLDEVE